MAINDNTVKWRVKKVGTSDTPVMSGATASAGGSAGLVPQPQAGDNSKFLTGDGRWREVPIPDVSGVAIVDAINSEASNNSIAVSKLNTSGGKTSGARLVMTDNLLTVYDDNNVARVKIGVF